MRTVQPIAMVVIFYMWPCAVLGQPSSRMARDLGGLFDENLVKAQEVAVMPAEAAGLIVRMPFGPQDFVRKGELLVQLDPNLIALEIQNIEAQIALSTKKEAAAVNLQYAEDSFEIIRNVYEAPIEIVDGKFSAFSEKEFKEAKQRLEIAKLGVRDARLEMKSLKIQLNQMRKRLSQMSIRAPWDGVIVPFKSVKDLIPQFASMKQPTVGEMVTAGQPVVVMMKVDVLKVQWGRKKEQLDNFYLGKPAQVYIPPDSREAIPSNVVFICPTVDSGGNVYIDLEFENPRIPIAGQPDRGFYRYRYRPGMKARVEIEKEIGGSSSQETNARF